MTNVLLSSVGRRSYLVQYFREALGGHGQIIGTNCLPDAPGLHAVDVPIVVPPACSPDYVPTMAKICRSYDVRLLFSLHDLEAPYLADHSAQFEEIGTRLVIPEAESTRIYLDKYATDRFLREHGFAAPVTCLGLERAHEAIVDGRVRFPLIVKPRRATGSIGLFSVAAPDELTPYVELCRREIVRRPFLSTVDSRDHEDVLIQQMVQGREYGLNILNDLEGRFAACFVVRKLGMHNGETDVGQTEHYPLLEELGETIGRASRHPGLMDVDVIVQEHTPYIIDINPRFGGHYPFAHMGGANAPAALIAWANGMKANPDWLRTTANIRSFKDIAIVRCGRAIPSGSGV